MAGIVPPGPHPAYGLATALAELERDALVAAHLAEQAEQTAIRLQLEAGAGAGYGAAWVTEARVLADLARMRYWLAIAGMPRTIN